MSKELSLFDPNAGAFRDARRASRAISRYSAAGHVRTVTVDLESDVAVAKVDAITSTTGQAMSAVVRVAQAQKQLEQLASETSGRLAFLADAHAMAVSDLLADLRRELRRK